MRKVIPPCDEGEHVWEETSPSCEVCGDGAHEGLYCTKCGETVDFVFDADPREVPA